MERPPRVGDWAYVCCEEDLYPIRDEDELRAALEWDAEEGANMEDGMPTHRYFATKADALAALHLAADFEWDEPVGGYAACPGLWEHRHWTDAGLPAP